jgi:hypothetical protein
LKRLQASVVGLKLLDMRIHVEDASLLEPLAGWLAARGWPVVDAKATDADVLVPWDRDEFEAALTLRADVLAWRAAHDGATVSVDEDVWMPAPRAA